MLPRRIPKERNRSERWRSQAHCGFVRSHGCCVPGCDGRPIEAAHIRIGSDAGMGRKPSDYFTVSLCKAHHGQQHIIGEPTFWREVVQRDPHDTAAEFAAKSPKAAEIRAIQRERAL